METVTVSEFMQKNEIDVTASKIEKRPDDLMNDMANHWVVNLFCGKTGNKLTVYYSGGSLVKTINGADVLASLASDAYMVENYKTFEEFASELGYDEDSRKAEKIYKACVHQSKRLKKFLTNKAMSLPLFPYRELLNASHE